ncbi:MAG: hypothetical protein QUS12_11515, partial [Methanosarcina sp.]|nr:hypothetical protein [Methanosarcina sp.]
MVCLTAIILPLKNYMTNQIDRGSLSGYFKKQAACSQDIDVDIFKLLVSVKIMGCKRGGKEFYSLRFLRALVWLK